MGGIDRRICGLEGGREYIKQVLQVMHCRALLGSRVEISHYSFVVLLCWIVAGREGGVECWLIEQFQQ